MTDARRCRDYRKTTDTFKYLLPLPSSKNEVFPIVFTTMPATEPQYDLYFTLKYVAGYNMFSGVKRQAYLDSYWSIHKTEVEAQNAIDALLCAPLPEQQLWQERRKLEARLFNNDKSYHPFL